MCGIAGIIAPNASRYREHAEKMRSALHHRGPDASGILAYDNALLVHTRLSIIDLATGDQPMRSALTPAVAVTFNGEIYGYQNLRTQLGAYPFHTTSDTEVVLALYHAAPNSRFVQRLPGMFAFALWDDAAQSLIAARDRFGEKPLYYATFRDESGQPALIFASEIKAVLATGLIIPRLDRDALSHYLQYLYVHPHQTIYENIHTLPPARTLTWQNNAAVVERYWQLPAPRQHEIRMKQAVEEFRELLRAAVRKQLVADVPVGAFLSGGLDSSTITAVAARHKPGLQTFAFRFDTSLDETPFAAAVATMHATTHRVLEDTHVDIAAMLFEMARVYDEPFADSSNIPTYLISKLARRHTKVVLTGDGGDEFLGGYAWYQSLLSPSETPVSQARLLQSQYFSDTTLEKFGLSPSAMPKRVDIAGTVDDAMRMDLLDYMPGDILVKIDRASMAHALELRAPFLDVPLATFLIALPARLKIDNESDKRVLRKAFADLWPPEIQQRTKHGFGAPVSDYLARPAVAAVAERLNDPHHPLFSLLPFDVTRIAVERRNYQTWSLLTLALWLESHPIGAAR